jgi:ribosome biogenesis protein BRX1
MPSVLKATTEIQRRKDKGKGKGKADGEVNGKEASTSTEPKQKPRKDKNLLISSRGVTQRMRHLMNDLEALLPHTKKGKLLYLPLSTRPNKTKLTLNRLEARF